MKIRAGWLAVAAAAAVFASDAHAMQDRAAVRAVRVSPDTVELGDPFTLHASVYVPPGADLRVPATLIPEWSVESLRRVRTEVVEVGDGSLQVALEYDLIPFEIGLAATPQLEVTSGEAEAGGERVRVVDGPGGDDPVGAGITQDAQSTRTGARTSLPTGADEGLRDRLVVSGRRVFVTSPVLLDDIAQGLQPRPPADVVGVDWNVPAVLGASLLSVLLLGVVTVQAREWRAAHAAAAVQVEAPPETPEEWRERALAELDRARARPPPGGTAARLLRGRRRCGARIPGALRPRLGSQPDDHGVDARPVRRARLARPGRHGASDGAGGGGEVRRRRRA